VGGGEVASVPDTNTVFEGQEIRHKYREEKRRQIRNTEKRH
jgi:hypothetical protein